MKIKVWISIIGLLATSALWAETAIYPKRPPYKPALEAFQSITTEVADLRARSLKFLERIAPVVNANAPLYGQDIFEMDTLVQSHLDIGQRLDEMIDYGKKEIRRRQSLTERHDLALTISLAASLLYIDSISDLVLYTQNDPALRQFINNPNNSFGRPKNVIQTEMKEFFSTSNYNYRVKLIDYYQSIKETESFKSSAELQFLASKIEVSPAYREEMDRTAYEHRQVKKDIRALRRSVGWRTMKDDVQNFFKHSVVSAVSSVFGNAVGSIQFRKGKLYKNHELAKRLAEVLKPGDLLLEKTPFRATDFFIPGYYGHVAIYVGDSKELKAIGLWNQPALRPHRQAINSKKTIVQALRKGVVISTIESFLDIDDLLVLRPKSVTSDQLAQAITVSLDQIGKKYDFSFDVEADDKIVCSELAYLAYGDVKFRLGRSLGRWTIDPDAVAEQGLADGYFEPVLIIRDQEEVKTDLKAALADILVLK